MGCGSSKGKLCQNCRSPYTDPVKRSSSMLVHHPPEKPGDTYHRVVLRSTTLGSLQLDPLNGSGAEENPLVGNQENVDKEEFSIGMIDAKAWSKMIDEKIPNVMPRTPARTPPVEPEVIDACEMMEGLEESSHISNSSLPCIYDQHRLKGNGYLPLVDSDSDSNPRDMSIVSDIDRESTVELRNALEKLPPGKNPFHLKPLDGENGETKVTKDGNVEKKLVVYVTSLRGVRKTYEDCCHVRVILKGLGVKVDERDVSMHSGFKEELRELLEEAFGRGGGGRGGLPRVFLGRKCIGGAEEIRRLNDEGKLAKMVANCEYVDNGRRGNGGACDTCGDIRFAPCETCSGSCKIYYDDEGVEEYGASELERGFRRCPCCNENGLVRCKMCCD